MQSQSGITQLDTTTSQQQTTHILVAGLETSDKHKFIYHVSDIPLEHVDVVGDLIPADLPELLMGEVRVDSQLTTCVWGAPDHWRHDYVNYLVNIKTILNERGNLHRVMGMVVVVDSNQTAVSEFEGKLVRLIQTDWALPYIIIASHPYDRYARHVETIREQYQINEDIPILPYDLSDAKQCKRALIELMYRTM